MHFFLVQHVGNCQYEIVWCENKCGAKLERRYLNNHMRNECHKRTIKCPYCAKEFVYETLQVGILFKYALINHLMLVFCLLTDPFKSLLASNQNILFKMLQILMFFVGYYIINIKICPKLEKIIHWFLIM